MREELKIAVVDDHKLFRRGLITFIEMVAPAAKIVFEADNGIHMQEFFKAAIIPDIITIDVNMPGMDGFKTVEWLKENYPAVKVLIVSMVEKEEAVVRMLKLGVKGYLCKDVEPAELAEALQSIASKGYYYTDYVTKKLVESVSPPQREQTLQSLRASLNDRELAFLQLACSELTYNEIADKMSLSPKTIDGYRNSLFEKFGVKSRVGLVLYAISNGLVSVTNET